MSVNLQVRAFLAAAGAGEEYPRFKDSAGIDARQMLRRVERAWRGKDYLAASEGLIAYIQSGKMTDPGHAFPRSCTEGVTATSRDGSASFFEVFDGPKLPAAHALESCVDLGLALVSHILPALEGLPATRADWLTLTRSVLEMMRRTGSWVAAE